MDRVQGQTLPALGVRCRILGERVLADSFIVRQKMAIVGQDLRNHFLERPAAFQPLPIPNTADSGYYSKENERDVAAVGLDPYFAVGREKHHAQATGALVANEAPAASSAAAPAAAAPAAAAPAAVADENPKAAMAKKLRTPTGRVLDAARKHIVEPVFGQIKRIRGFRKFLLRGLELVSAEWQLICLTHNLLKIWRHVSSVF